MPDWAAGNLLLLPTSIWFLVLLVIPTLLILQYSLGHRSVYEPIRFTWSSLVWSNYRTAVNPQFLPILIRSVVYALASTFLCVAARLPAGVLDRALLRPAPQLLSRARDHPVPHELPHPDLRMARDPPAQRRAQLVARPHRPGQRPRFPQHALRGDPRPHLRLPPVHDPAALRVDRTDGQVAGGGELRPRPRQDVHALSRHHPDVSCPGSSPACSSCSSPRSATT